MRRALMKHTLSLFEGTPGAKATHLFAIFKTKSVQKARAFVQLEKILGQQDCAGGE
jgi:hypothetical protein